MISNIRKQQTHPIYRLISGLVAVTFIFSSVVPPTVSYAQIVPTTALNLPVPGAMVPLSGGFTPPMINGITIHPNDPFKFNFLVGQGDNNLQGDAFESEAMRLIKYFLASLTVPEKELWVNLSPYEENRIIPDSLSKTELGRDMLAQDYILKQLTASLMYPEDELGEKFWNRVRNTMHNEYGQSDIPVDTFNKVWIVPQKATVYETENTAIVVDSYLKVMLEHDYFALDNAKTDAGDLSLGETPNADIIKEIIIPAIEREVNEGETFAPLRQIYNSMILATWYKKNLKDSLLGQVYVDQNKIGGIDSVSQDTKDEIYNRYLEAFKVGVYNYIKEEIDPNTQQIIPRKYFAGGITPFKADQVSSPVNGDSRALHNAVSLVRERNREFTVGLETSDGQKLTAASPVLSQRDARRVDDIVWTMLGDDTDQVIRAASPKKMGDLIEAINHELGVGIFQADKEKINSRESLHNVVAEAMETSSPVTLSETIIAELSKLPAGARYWNNQEFVMNAFLKAGLALDPNHIKGQADIVLSDPGQPLSKDAAGRLFVPEGTRVVKANWDMRSVTIAQIMLAVSQKASLAEESVQSASSPVTTLAEIKTDLQSIVDNLGVIPGAIGAGKFTTVRESHRLVTNGVLYQIYLKWGVEISYDKSFQLDTLDNLASHIESELRLAHSRSSASPVINDGPGINAQNFGMSSSTMKQLFAEIHSWGQDNFSNNDVFEAAKYVSSNGRISLNKIRELLQEAEQQGLLVWTQNGPFGYWNVAPGKSDAIKVLAGQAQQAVVSSPVTNQTVQTIAREASELKITPSALAKALFYISSRRDVDSFIASGISEVAGLPNPAAALQLLKTFETQGIVESKSVSYVTRWNVIEDQRDKLRVLIMQAVANARIIDSPGLSNPKEQILYYIKGYQNEDRLEQHRFEIIKILEFLGYSVSWEFADFGDFVEIMVSDYDGGKNNKLSITSGNIPRVANLREAILSNKNLQSAFVASSPVTQDDVNGAITRVMDVHPASIDPKKSLFQQFDFSFTRSKLREIIRTLNAAHGANVNDGLGIVHEVKPEDILRTLNIYFRSATDFLTRQQRQVVRTIVEKELFGFHHRLRAGEYIPESLLDSSDHKNIEPLRRIIRRLNAEFDTEINFGDTLLMGSLRGIFNVVKFGMQEKSRSGTKTVTALREVDGTTSSPVRNKMPAILRAIRKHGGDLLASDSMAAFELLNFGVGFVTTQFGAENVRGNLESGVFEGGPIYRLTDGEILDRKQAIKLDLSSDAQLHKLVFFGESDPAHAYILDTGSAASSPVVLTLSMSQENRGILYDLASEQILDIAAAKQAGDREELERIFRAIAFDASDNDVKTLVSAVMNGYAFFELIREGRMEVVKDYSIPLSSLSHDQRTALAALVEDNIQDVVARMETDDESLDEMFQELINLVAPGQEVRERDVRALVDIATNNKNIFDFIRTGEIVAAKRPVAAAEVISGQDAIGSDESSSPVGGSAKNPEIFGETSPTSSEVGGIDLDSEHLNLHIERDGNGIPLPVSMQPIELININGLVPVIINVAPVSMPLIFGANYNDNDFPYADSNEDRSLDSARNEYFDIMSNDEEISAI